MIFGWSPSNIQNKKSPPKYWDASANKILFIPVNSHICRLSIRHDTSRSKTDLVFPTFSHKDLKKPLTCSKRCFFVFLLPILDHSRIWLVLSLSLGMVPIHFAHRPSIGSKNLKDMPLFSDEKFRF